ncbi:MAG: A/G-specific adenine glycosylase, partial [Chloroflexota bacterium]
MSEKTIAAFRYVVYEHYRHYGRAFPWRETSDPYHILVSEIMLQQTQTARVLTRYEPFLAAFPHFASLAVAPLRAVLEAWQGLGYNRRALALHQTAQRVMSCFEGELPSSPDALVRLPG